MRNIGLLLSIFIAAQFGAGAQTVPSAGTEITKAIPPSADAASLGKYGSIPISAYTGVPNISVPLYTVKSGDISLPVSISYHAGGNKVEEKASSVGLGWALNAGGAITRTIRGFDDELEFGFLDPAHYAARVDSVIANKGGTLTTAQLNFYLNLMADGTVDSEPDMYNFNFAGYSGKFVMDGYGNIMVIPQQKITFTFEIAHEQRTFISAFTAKTPDGNTYYFGRYGGGVDAIEYTSTTNSCTGGHPQFHTTSWFLKRILSPTGHIIDFTYTYSQYSQTQAPSQTMYQWNGFISPIQPTQPSPPPPDQYCTSVNVMNTVKVSSIKFENGEVNVFSNTQRADMNAGAKLTDSITISGGGFSKKYLFYYLNSGSTRLRLDSLVGQLEKIPGTSNYKKEKHSFMYSYDPWTPTSTFGQDWWGYYNGQSNFINGHGTLVPWALMPDPSGNPRLIRLPGAERKPDETSLLGGMLTQINYPTGGYTAFEYEANQDYNANLGGTSPRYPTYESTTANSNDSLSLYFNYDSLNGNPSHNMNVYTNDSAGLPIRLSGSGLKDQSQPPPEHGWFSASIFNVTGGGHTNVHYINNADTVIYLPTGQYRIEVIDHNGTSQGYKYMFLAKWTNDNAAVLHNYIAGGVRVKQIADYDGISPAPANLKTYTYKLPGQNVSSG